MTKTKIGLFGTGHLGRIHARIIKGLSNRFDFVGFFDPNDENASKCIEETGARRFTSETELIDACDCVDIVTPTIHHFKVAQNALSSKKSIFIEKPITKTVEEAEKLIALADENNAKILVGHVERFNPAFVAALPKFNDPLFIETHRLAQYNPRGTDVPVVLDLMIHDLDAILSVVQSPVKAISASGVAVVSESPDIANARIEFENGCVANLTASRISLKNMRKSRFFQKDAYISVDFLEKQAEIVSMTTIEGEPDPFDLIFDLGNDKPKKKIEIIKPEVNTTNAIEEELINFHEVLTQNKKAIVSGKQGLEALKVALEIMEKIKVNQSLIQQNILTD